MHLRRSHPTKKVLQLCVVIEANWTYRDDHFTIYANVESLGYTPETNIMLYVTSIAIQKPSELTGCFGAWRTNAYGLNLTYYLLCVCLFVFGK